MGKLAIALVGCRPAKFRRDRKANCFRDALDKDQLEQLEQLEKLVARLIEQTDMCPLAAVEDAAIAWSDSPCKARRQPPGCD